MRVGRESGSSIMIFLYNQFVTEQDAREVGYILCSICFVVWLIGDYRVEVIAEL